MFEEQSRFYTYMFAVLFTKEVNSKTTNPLSKYRELPLSLRL